MERTCDRSISRFVATFGRGSSAQGATSRFGFIDEEHGMLDIRDLDSPYRDVILAGCFVPSGVLIGTGARRV